MHKFEIGRLSGPEALPHHVIESMYRLRYRVFHERLNWEVTVDKGREKDGFDDKNSVYVVGVNDETQEAEASWRLRPTTKPYMLQQTFPHLLQGRDVPRSPAVWEVSRFAVINTPYALPGTGSFGDLTRELVARTVMFGDAKGIADYIWVTSVGVERMARKLGYRVERWGSPVMVGSVNCVVNDIGVTPHSVWLAKCHLGLATDRRRAQRNDTPWIEQYQQGLVTDRRRNDRRRAA